MVQYLVPFIHATATESGVCLRELVYFVYVLSYCGDFSLLGVCEVTLHQLPVLIAVDVAQVESSFFEHLVSLRLEQDLLEEDVHVIEVAVYLQLLCEGVVAAGLVHILKSDTGFERVEEATVLFSTAVWDLVIDLH